jgi:hypothetical protein
MMGYRFLIDGLDSGIEIAQARVARRIISIRRRIAARRALQARLAALAPPR